MARSGAERGDEAGAPTAPWLRLVLAPAPEAVRLLLCRKGEEPKAVALEALRGEGELSKVLGVVVRELLP